MVSMLQRLKTDRKSAGSKDPTKKVLMFELVPALQAPAIVGKQFHNPKTLRIFNVMIRDLVSNDTFSYMWHEGEGIRGVNEICSCLMKHILSLPSNVTSITLFSRAGHLIQNALMSSTFLTCIQCHPGLLCIEHIIIPVNRLYECESQYELINNLFQTSASYVNIPSDWYKVVGKCSDVIEMKGKFYLYQNLFHGSNPLVKPKSTTDSFSVDLNKMYWFQYIDGLKPFLVSLKGSYDEGVPFKHIDFLRHGLSEPILKNSLQLRTPHLLPKKRKEEILSALHLIEEVHHSLYLNLHVNEAVTDSEEEIV